ncbi:MAG: glycogen-binding domain-containing protein [Elusimicrobiales bacterium]|nr:glycogen-binding domain-containing protein [Elusimicrobiales bacterium]
MKRKFFYNPAVVIVFLTLVFFAYSAANSAASYFAMTKEWKTPAANEGIRNISGIPLSGMTSEVIFKKNLKKASKVSIKGDFNGWKEERLEKQQNGVWEIRKTLKPGTYKYVYVADGKEQLEDFSAKIAFENGRKVSVIEIK